MMSVTVYIVAVIQMLILLCCDVETNPGPTLGKIHVSLTNVMSTLLNWTCYVDTFTACQCKEFNLTSTLMSQQQA